MKSYQIKNNKTTLANVYQFTDKKTCSLTNIVSEVPEKQAIGFAGFRAKKYLENYLALYIPNKKIQQNKITDYQIKNKAKTCLIDCFSIIKSTKLELFIFPTANKFVKNKMDGIAGDTVWKNTILLFIHPDADWERKFSETLVHEVAHAYSLNYLERKSLLDYIVFEGLAEHFREHLIGGEMSYWAKTLEKSESLILFDKLKSKLMTDDFKIRKDVFYAGKTYPLWAGYSIGYYLISDYLKNLPSINWPKILKTPPSEIARDSGWFSTK